MKQLIKLICLGAFAERETQVTHASNRQSLPEGELVWRGIDGTVIAREVNLAPRGT
jgi:hypothetical protein